MAIQSPPLQDTLERLSHIARHAGIRLCVTDTVIRPVMGEVALRAKSLQQVVTVDEHREVDPVEKGPDVVGALLERHPDHGEVLVAQFVVKCLPPGQVVAAASPRGERDQQPPTAPPVGESGRLALEVGQCEVGGDPAPQRLGPA